MKNITLGTAAAVLIALAGCNQESKPAEPKAPAAESPALPSGLFASGTLPDGKALHTVKASAKQGDSVVITGYIGGREEPFTAGRVLFLMVDAEKAPACTEGCETPWDACCTASDEIAANSATIQVVDGTGQVLKVGLEGKGGLAPGATVTIAGKVREASAAILIVDATSISAAKLP